MLKAADFRKIARDGLKGRWLLAVGAGIIATILGGSASVGGGGSSAVEQTVDNPSVQSALENISPDIAFADGTSLVSSLEGAVSNPVVQNAVLAMIGVASFAAVLYLVITLIIGGAVSLGYARFNLNLINRAEPDIRDVFSEMRRFKTGFVMQFLKGLYIFLWALLLVVPGIIAAYSYAMTPYILMENPDMTANEAIAASKELMKGNKWRLFCLGFSFIGWDILSSFTMGIGNLFLRPYREAANAAFYREIKWERHKKNVDSNNY